jgi:hypothetical protein
MPLTVTLIPHPIRPRVQPHPACRNQRRVGLWRMDAGTHDVPKMSFEWIRSHQCMIAAEVHGFLHSVDRVIGHHDLEQIDLNDGYRALCRGASDEQLKKYLLVVRRA